MLQLWAPIIFILYIIRPSNGWSYSSSVIADLENTIYEELDESDQRSNGAGGSLIVGVTGAKGGARIR